MLAMLSRLPRSSRPDLSLQLIRYFSIRVPSLKKESLVAQLLRGKASPKLTNSTQKGELFLDAAGPKYAKALPLSQQGEASLKSVHPHPPLCLSAELPGLENGRQKEDDAGSAHVAKPSLRSRKGVQRSDVAAKVFVLSSREEGCKADPCEGEAELPELSKLSMPCRIKGSKAHNSVGATQPCVGAQAVSKRSETIDCDGKAFQTRERKFYRSEVSVQPQIAGEEGRHSHIPAETNPSGESLALQIWGASKSVCRSFDKLETSLPDAGFWKETSSLVSAVGDEPGKCIKRKLSSSKKEEDGEIQNAVEHNLFQLKSAVEREISKRLEVEKLVELYSEIIRKEFTDPCLNDWQQMSAETDRFFNNLQQKIDILSTVALIRVKALLMNREFLSVSPKKLAEVLTILKQFFESSDEASEILARKPKMMVQPLEQLQERLKVFVEFEVDKATGFRFATTVRSLSAEKFRRNLSFLKDLGLSAAFRNRIVFKAPHIMSYSLRNRMQSIANFFESIEIARPTFMKLFELCPVLLLTVPDKKLRVIYKLFQHVGLSSMEYIEALGQLRYVRSDVFLHYNLFRKQGLSDEAFAGIMTRNPRILSLTVECVEAKLHFLLHKANWDISDAIAFPHYFNYSLANRIIPRFKLLEELNLSRRPTLSTVILSRKLNYLAV